MKETISIPLKPPHFRFDYFRAGGKGGQHQNKTDSACRVVHIASGSKGESRTARSQHQNKKLALERLIKTVKFRLWLAAFLQAKDEGYRDLDKKIDMSMKSENLRVETLENGEWCEQRG